MTEKSTTEELTDQDVNDALSEGIGAVLDGSVDEDDPSIHEGEEPEAEADAEGDGAGEEPGDGEAGDGGESTAAGDADGAGPEADTGAEEGEKGGAEPLDYSMPDGLSDRAQDRFTKLVEANKEKDNQINGMGQTLMGMRKMVEDTGMSNEEFIGALDLMRALKTNPEDGIKRVQQYIDQVARENGIQLEPFEYDALSDFPDLKADVEDMRISPEYAAQIAKQRRQEARQKEQQEKQEQQDGAKRQWESARNEALPQIGKLIDGYQKNDIDWDAKADLMLEAAAYARDNLPPPQWVPYMKQEYKRITDIATKVAGKRGNGTEQPLMGNSSVRGGQKEPGDIGDWIDQNL